MDNAGENKLFEQRVRSKDWQLGIQMEYTPRDMPQHNHLAELAFAEIGNKGRAMLVHADVPVAVLTVPASPNNLRCFVHRGLLPNMCWYRVALLPFTVTITSPSRSVAILNASL